MNFRKDIQGLRAISVIGVLIYHSELTILNNKILQGGFLGVDIFFVISGFLITKIIYNKLSSNTFSFKKFYEKRARRILPSLFLILFFTAIGSYFLLDHNAYLENINTTIAAIFFNSNHFFSIQDSYIAEPSRYKPLLHTWSLGVEEQFYFIFPAFAYLFYKKKFFIFTSLFFFLSFAFSLHAARTFPDVNFYLLASRFWEFLLGSLIVFYEKKFKFNKITFDFLRILSIFLILSSFIFLNNSISHPGFYTLVPTLAVAFIIFSSTENNSTMINLLLCNKISLFFGKISYTLYLVHFPIFVFARIYEQKIGTSNSVKIFLILISIFLSTIIYYFYEQKFRDEIKINIKKFLIFMFSYIVLFLIIFIHAHYKSYSLNYINFNDVKFDIKEEKSKRWKYLTEQCTKIGWEECYKPQKNKINILAVGDSMAPDAANMLNAVLNLDKYYVITDTLGGCPPIKDISLHVNKDYPNLFECSKKNKLRFSKKNYDNIEIVIINNNYNWSKSGGLEDYLFFLKKIGIKKIILVGNYVQLKKEFIDIIRENKNIINTQNIPDEIISHKFLNEEYLNNLANKFEILFLSFKNLCQDNKCVLFTDNKIPFTWDQNHLTKEFSEFYAQNIYVKNKILNYFNFK